MPTEVTSSDSGYKVKIELPGIKNEDIKVQANINHLFITVTTQRENVKKLKLNTLIDIPKITCKLDLGILNIDLPCKEDCIHSTRNIEIN